MPKDIERISALLHRIAEQQEGQAALPSSDLINIITSFCNLRAAMTTGRNLDAESIIVKALSIGQEYCTWQFSLPRYRLYNKVASDDLGPTVPIGYRYTWQNLGFAHLQIVSWMTQIVLHGLILQQLEVLFTSRQARVERSEIDCAGQVQKSRTVIRSLIDHICASTPYFLSLCASNRIHDPSSCSDTSSLPCAAATSTILKPLFVAGDSHLCPPGTRAWVVQQLHTLGSTMGLRQATFLAGVIIEKESSTDWLLDDRSWNITFDGPDPQS